MVPSLRKIGDAASLRAGYNPLQVESRPFHADYSQMASGASEGRLGQSIEGTDLRAPFVAGRRVYGGGDVGLTGAEVRQIAENFAAVSGTTKKELGGAVGRFREAYGADGNIERSIQGLRTLSPQDAGKVLAHETGHAIDSLAGKIKLDDRAPRRGVGAVLLGGLGRRVSLPPRASRRVQYRSPRRGSPGSCSAGLWPIRRSARAAGRRPGG